MMNRDPEPQLILLIFSSVLGALLLMAWSLAPVPVAASDFPPRPTLRPIVTPTSIPVSRSSKKDSDPDGAFIEVRVASPQPGLWSVVQWQDNDDGWHNVDGWQGTLNSVGHKRWWVDQKDWSTGPFRWILLDQQDGVVVATSENFSLPGEADQLQLIPVTLSFRVE